MYLSQILSLLALLSLTFAAPLSNPSTCISQQWNMQQFEAFTAGDTSTIGSHLSFYFTDPNFDSDRALCERSMELGQSTSSGKNSLVDFNWYYCSGSMAFRYLGASIDLQETGVQCGNITYTVQGSTGLSPECYSINGGTQCETLTQVNVNPSQLTITSVKGGAKH